MIQPAMIKRHFHLVVAALLVAALTPDPVAAQAAPSRFTNGQLLVIAANRFVNEPSGTTFRSDEQFVLTRQPTATRGAAAGESVSMRIFSLQAGRNVPTELFLFEPCFVYLSLLLPVRVNAAGTINVGSLSEDWLQPTRGGTVEPGHYLVVFERGAGDGHHLFRLNRADRDTYFRQGLLVRVVPARSLSRDDVDAMAQRADAYDVEVRKQAAVNDAKSTCYVARLTAGGDLDDDASVFAMSDECDPPR